MTIRNFAFEFLPYCLLRRADGTYDVVNIDMKPVAFRHNQFGFMGDAAGFVRFEGLTPEIAARLSFSGDTQLDRIYLFNEARVPTGNSDAMADYLYRLGILTSLQTAEVD